MRPIVRVDRLACGVNVDRLHQQALAAGVAVRAHVKGHRTLEITELQLSAGACGIVAQTTREADAHISVGASNIVLARSRVEDWRWPVFARFAGRAGEAGVSVVVHVPDENAATLLAAAARQLGTQVAVRLEVELGGGRGTEPRLLTELAELVDHSPSLRLEGITGYWSPRQRHMLEIWELHSISQAETLVRLAAELRRRGLNISTTAVSGTANFRAALSVPGITEVCVGAYSLYDAGSVTQGLCQYQDVAISVDAVVTQADSDGVLTNADAILAGAYQQWAPGEVAVLRDGTPLSRSGLTVGDRISLLPAHICPFLLGVNELHIGPGNTTATRWRTVLLPERQPIAGSQNANLTGELMAHLGRDHQEVMVVTIWKDLLGERPANLDDDFFVSGGDSVLATIFASRLSESIDGEITLEDFFSKPTPRGLAALLRGHASPAGEGVVCMRSEGTGQLLVLLPVGVGMGFLAGESFDRPVVALEPIGMHGGSVGPAELNDLAPELAGRIQSLSAAFRVAPLQLIGRCAGSLLALAVACELEQRGEAVSAVHLFDPPAQADDGTVEEITTMWVKESAVGVVGEGDPLPVTPGELFERLQARGVDVLQSSRAQFTQRVAAVVATQHAAMQYPRSRYGRIPLRSRVHAYAPADSPVLPTMPDDLYGALDLRLIILDAVSTEVFSHPGIPTVLADTMHQADEAAVVA